MPATDKRLQEALEKADFLISDLTTTGGYLNPEQSNRFLDMVVDQPTILKDLRVEKMGAPKWEVNKLGFGSRVLKPGPGENTVLAASDRSAPTTSKITLTSKNLQAESWIPYNVLEDNIEKEGFEAHFLNLLAARASLDLEEWIVLGDTGSGDAYLALVDGAIASVSTNVINHIAAPVGVSKGIFKECLRTIAPKYLREKASMRFFTGHDVHIEWQDEIADRLTSLGDSRLTTNVGTPAYGIPVVPSVHMPSTKFLLTHPKNMILGVQRDIRLETDRDIRQQSVIVVITLRVDFTYETEEAVVLFDGVNPDA